jgi:CheY-like chemotaxis protein
MPKLLIADSSPMMHRIMELTFAPEGLQVLTASDGEQAISLLSVARPDLVIADHALARRSGYEVASFIREHEELGRIPVLLLASPFEPLDRERAEAAGVAGEIAKPFDPVQLVMRVRDLLARKDEEPVRAETAVETGQAPGLKLVTSASAPARGALDDYFDRLDAALAKLDDQSTGRADGVASPGDLGGSPVPREVARRRDDRDDGDGPKVPTLEELLGTPVVADEDEGMSKSASVSTGALIPHPLGGAYADTGDKRADEERADEQRADDDRGDDEPVHDHGAVVDEHADLDDLGSLVNALEALRTRNTTPPPPVAASATATVPSAAPEASTDIGAADRVTVSDALVDEVTRRVIERLAPGAVNEVVTDIVTRVADRLLREEIARLK